MNDEEKKIKQKAWRIARAIKIRKQREDQRLLQARITGTATYQVRDIVSRIEARKREIYQKGYSNI